MALGIQCHMPTIQQMTLPGWPASVMPVTVKRRVRTGARPPKLLDGAADDVNIQTYQQRLVARGAAEKGRQAYIYQLRVMLRIAACLVGHAVTLEELFEDPTLLGRCLVHDRNMADDASLSRWTLAQRRSAIRSFATLLRPELARRLGEDPHVRLDCALRLVAERVGTGFRLPGGKPRQRGGTVPTAEEIAALLATAGQQTGYWGQRDQAFFRILAETGTRINALRSLDGEDCIEMPSGRLRLYVHAKGKREQREIELSDVAAECLCAYAHAFNRLAVTRGWKARVQIGKPGPLWRNSGIGCWPYASVVAALRAACRAAELTPFTPHALRRAFATDAARDLARHIVAKAGGWQGLERLDDHYIHPRTDLLWRKLIASERLSFLTPRQKDTDDVSTPAV
ncbi:MAG: tyrosine-type recombinase/integrase [bacterium]